jgi:hypothetical protein
VRFAITVVAITGLLLIPANAGAAGCPPPQKEANGTTAADYPTGPPTGRCVGYSEWLEELAAAPTAYETQITVEAAAKIKEEHAEQNKETGGPVTFLRATAVSHHGTSYRHPGATVVTISSNLWAEVTATFARTDFPFPETTKWKLGQPDQEILEIEDHGTEQAWEFVWNCHSPRAQYSFAITVHGENEGIIESGPGLTASGHIVAGLSAKWCKFAKEREAVTKKRETQAKERRFRQEVKEQVERERHTAERERAELERFVTNCRAIGGIPVGIDTSRGPETVCRSQGGGIISVPT